jgi:hypothetical protein
MSSIKTFSEWMEERHPEAIEEGFFKNLALGTALAAGAAGLGGKFLQGSGHPTSGRPAAAAQEDDFDDDDDMERGVIAKEQKLRAAAQRVGIPRSQWNNLRGEMRGGVVTVVNGKTVPLTPAEKERVEWARGMQNRMPRASQGGQGRSAF